MAMAHPGYAVGNDTRLRLLLGIFEATNQGRPPTRGELHERTGISAGSISFHLPRLVKAGLLEDDAGARGAWITKAGLHSLAHAGLIEVVAHEPVYSLTPKGLRLLELAPVSRREPQP